MPKLINADTLKRAVHNEWDDCLVWDESGSVTAEEMERIIDSQPAVDAVEVVRCKDCIYREVQVDLVYRYEICGIRNEIINLNGFCHMGKRREDANTN